MIHLTYQNTLEDETVWLDTLDVYARQNLYGSENRIKAVAQKEVSIGGTLFTRGIASRSNSKIVLDIQGIATRFQSHVGIDDGFKDFEAGLIIEVKGDGRNLWQSSSILKNGDSPEVIDIDVTNVSCLELFVSDTGKAINRDYVVWAEAKLITVKNVAEKLRAKWLSDVQPAVVRPGYAELRLDRAPSGNHMMIGMSVFSRGVGAKNNSDIIYTFQRGMYKKFDGWIGIDRESGNGIAKFKILVDGDIRFESPVMSKKDAALFFSVSLEGAKELRLVVNGEKDIPIFANWANASLHLAAFHMELSTYEASFEVASKDISIKLTDKGEISGISFQNSKSIKRNIFGMTSLAGCKVEEHVSHVCLENGGIEFRKRLVDPIWNRRCQLFETFTPFENTVKWEIDIIGDNDPWSTAIESTLLWRQSEKANFWTTWGNPDMDNGEWTDPLESRPFRDLLLYYGAHYFREDNDRSSYCPFYPELFAVPIASVLEDNENIGLSLVLSPADIMLDMSQRTSDTGEITFSRINHRISKQNTIHFTMHIVPHESDWRGGMGWMADKYPDYFYSPNATAHKIAGCGAYSMHEGELEAEKLKKMAFSVNWKASLDFPYMGMFIPPLEDDKQMWSRFNEDGSYEDDGNPDKNKGTEKASIQALREYSERMRELGFYVLNYFNVTEFGKKITGPENVTKDKDDPELWKYANDFLFHQIADGILYWPKGTPLKEGLIGTWGWAVATDPAGPDYQKFLLDQAQRHIDKIPASAGICIDRMDWLRFYNDREDDGVSWRNDQPVRSLIISWNQFIERLGSMMHLKDKVIFCNNHFRRIDLLKEIDGIFGEFEYVGVAANLAAFCGFGKPVIGWLTDEDQLKPNADQFLQKYLHLGMHTMVPFPQNNHSIIPKTKWGEQQFLDYGPMMNAMKGRKWVLKSHAAQVENDLAKVNIFETDDGYIIPLTYGKINAVKLVLKNLPRLSESEPIKVEMIHPGSETWLPLKSGKGKSEFVVEVPLKRRCALVKVT